MTREKLIEVIARGMCVADDVDPDVVGYDRTGRDFPNWYVVQGAAETVLTALEAAGVRLVPAELDSKSLDHWKIASAGINAIEEFGGQFGSDHTPERQIADAYRDMISLAASPYSRKDTP